MLKHIQSPRKKRTNEPATLILTCSKAINFTESIILAQPVYVIIPIDKKEKRKKEAMIKVLKSI